MAPKRLNPGSFKKRVARIGDELTEMSKYADEARDWVGPNRDRVAQASSDLGMAAFFVQNALKAFAGWKKALNSRNFDKDQYEE